MCWVYPFAPIKVEGQNNLLQDELDQLRERAREDFQAE
jgi:hypothetical protein